MVSVCDRREQVIQAGIIPGDRVSRLRPAIGELTSFHSSSNKARHGWPGLLETQLQQSIFFFLLDSLLFRPLSCSLRSRRNNESRKKNPESFVEECRRRAGKDMKREDRTGPSYSPFGTSLGISLASLNQHSEMPSGGSAGWKGEYGIGPTVLSSFISGPIHFGTNKLAYDYFFFLESRFGRR